MFLIQVYMVDKVNCKALHTFLLHFHTLFVWTWLLRLPNSAPQLHPMLRCPIWLDDHEKLDECQQNCSWLWSCLWEQLSPCWLVWLLIVATVVVLSERFIMVFPIHWWPQTPTTMTIGTSSFTEMWALATQCKRCHCMGALAPLYWLLAPFSATECNWKVPLYGGITIN